MESRRDKNELSRREPSSAGGREATRASRERFCDTLIAAREQSGKSLDDIAGITRIPIRSLERLEAGEFERLPADVFVRGFLRSYARCVGLDVDETIRRYGECGMTPAPGASAMADELVGAMATLESSAPPSYRVSRASTQAASDSPARAPSRLAAATPATGMPSAVQALGTGKIAEIETRPAAETGPEIETRPAADTGPEIETRPAADTGPETRPVGDDGESSDDAREAGVSARAASQISRNARKRKRKKQRKRKRQAGTPRSVRLRAGTAPVDDTHESAVAEPVEHTDSEPVVASAADESAASESAASASAASAASESAESKPLVAAVMEDSGAEHAVSAAGAEDTGASAASAADAADSAAVVRPVATAEDTARKRMPRPMLVIDDDCPDEAERIREARDAARERDDATWRNFLPPSLLDSEEGSRRGALTLAVIILVIVATLTMSYLMRRPNDSGDGVTRGPGQGTYLAS